MINTYKFLKPITLSLLTSVAANPTYAAIMTFNDFATFEAAVGTPVTTETLNGFATDTSFLSPLDVGDFTISTLSTVTSAGGQPSNQIDTSPYGFASSAIDGTTFGQAILEDGEALTFTFDAPIFAFGINTKNLGNSGLLTSLWVDGEFFTPAQDGRSLLFSGLISDDPFSSVSMIFDSAGATSGTADGFGFDNISYGGAAAVPVPASLPLLAAGLTAIGLLRQRRR